MDYFPNGDFTKSYPLPGISYYMSGMPTSVPNGQGLGQGQQSILGLSTPTFDGQQFMDADFSAFQHQQYAQQQPGFGVPRHQYSVGQKRKAAGYQYQQPQKEEGMMGEAGTVGKDGRKLDPFAPECSIPLPYQLGDEYSDKRLSKVETLRFAIRYIHHLEKLLADARHDEQCDCDFTVRSSSVSDSCQSPAVTTTGDQQQQHQHGNTKKARKYGRRGSSDETSDENEDNGH